MEDIWFGKPIPSHVRQEDQRLSGALPDREPQAAVHLEMQPPAAMLAARGNVDRQIFVQQLSLHEGRRQRVLRSSAVQALAGAEAQDMGRGLNGEGEGPDHLSPWVTH